MKILISVLFLSLSTTCFADMLTCRTPSGTLINVQGKDASKDPDQFVFKTKDGKIIHGSPVNCMLIEG